MHPHIVQFHEVFLMKDYLAIVSEYAAGGDLADYIDRLVFLVLDRLQPQLSNFSHSLAIADVTAVYILEHVFSRWYVMLWSQSA